MASSVHEFTGSITAVGSTSGTRVVVGAWDVSPFGAFADAMVEQPDGHRVLVAPDDDVAGFVADTYAFDEVVVAPVECTVSAVGVSFAGGGLDLDVVLGGRRPLGRLLGAVPRGLRRRRSWARACDPVARLVQPGVRTIGSAGHGRTEWYAARDLHAVASAGGAWRGTPLGALADVSPAVRFGFASAPRRPSSTTLSSFVTEPGG